MKTFLSLATEYRDYVWGGDRLRPGHAPTAEAWVIHEHDRIAGGPYSGKTLGELAGEYGAALLGERAIVRTGRRFPLLIKLLDCAQWLSLQVHPDDEQAVRLEGPGQFGKTEAWHVLDTAPGARLIAGFKPETPASAIAEAVRSGAVVDLVQYQAVTTGDTLYMPAGTIHALGPGLLIYEIQQASDCTYRVYDWGRSPTPQRPLHIEKSIQVMRAVAAAPALPLPTLGDGGRAELVRCDYFTLELLAGHSHSLELDTGGVTFHALTVIEGAARLQAGDQAIEIGKFQSVVAPASLGGYQLEPVGNCRVLKASV